MNDKKRRQTFCDMENVHVFNIAIICIHGEELLRQLAFHQEHKHITLQLCNKVQEFISKMSEEPEDFTGRIILQVDVQ